MGGSQPISENILHFRRTMYLGRLLQKCTTTTKSPEQQKRNAARRKTLLSAMASAASQTDVGLSVVSSACSPRSEVEPTNKSLRCRVGSGGIAVHAPVLHGGTVWIVVTGIEGAEQKSSTTRAENSALGAGPQAAQSQLPSNGNNRLFAAQQATVMSIA